ncbi:PREDICTED: uncharacterized protein LOC109155947 isoform X2 [Ipomoea nil]|uniref:uncharacterized protein LOC109155947 isoform X1 n=1 Tax=Ipomoea nil TaxID=35883 RepID=UPI000900F4C3|nr:PREDICTED: uncharacterized protein LOC109155947 isoform X1 [Ipomoea nil]XP_019159218.1 PREDICTED: uncharacterized protein LOC109155947 isoform X2 [Ipomoea nil]
MALQPSKLGLEESVASLKQQEPPPVDKTETALSNKIVQAAAEGSITISQQISESLLLVNEIKPPPLPKLGLEESVASLKQQERPPVDKMETPLSNTLVQASAGGSTMTSQQISESLLLDIEIITLRLSKLGLEESVASLKQLEPPPQLQHPSLVSLKRRAIGESSYPIIPLKQPNQDTHPSPFKITGISSLDTAVRPLKKRLLLTWPVEESLEKSSSLQPLHCHSSTEAELASPLKFNLTMEVPKKRRTPKSTNKFEREAAHKRQQRLPISSSYKKPVAEMMAAPLQQPEVNLEKKEKNAQMLDMVFHSAEMEENEKTMLLSISSLAKRFDGNKGMRTAAMQMMSGSAPKEGNAVVGKSVEEMHVKMPVLQKDEKQPVSRKGKEKVVAESIEELHVKMPVLEEDENQPLSRKGKEKVVAKSIEEIDVFEENDDPPFIIAGDVHQPKLKVYNLRKRKPNQIPRAANPTDVETAVTKVTAEMKEKPKRLRNKKKRKEEVPKFTARFVFPLTAKEIAEDLLSMTATKPSRQKIRRPAELQKEIDKLCPTKVKFKISPDDY